jgi:predicted GTPase
MHDPIAGPEPGLTRDPISAQYHWQDQAIELTDTAGWMKRTKLENYDEARGGMGQRGGGG